MNFPSVSIVVPVYNAEKTIQRTLEAVFTQSYSGLVEVIVVDDGSSDRSASIVKSFPRAKYIHQENRGPASARNRGLRESSASIIFFTDSDCIPESNWVSKAVSDLDDPKIAVVAGSYSLANEQSILARCIHKEILFRHVERMPKFPKSFGSYNFCARKSMLLEVGGFSEEYPLASGEDNDLSYKIIEKGYRIYFDKDLCVRHYHSERIAHYLREQYRHGFWRVKMYLHHPQMMAGDDYTFWKDIFEPALVLTWILSVIFMRIGAPAFLSLSIILPAILLLVELFYGWLITKSVRETVFWAFVMALRSFSRSFGFLAGIAYFLCSKSPKKVK